VKRRRTIFHTWVGPNSHNKCVRSHYTELVFFHSVGFVGHVVHSGGSGAQNIDALFSFLGGHGAVFTRSAMGHIVPNLCFCIQWDMWVT
jgi:hypothetical protein